MNTYKSIPTFFSKRVQDAIKSIESILIKSSIKYTYETVDLSATTPNTAKTRKYEQEFRNIMDKQGLYMIYPTCFGKSNADGNNVMQEVLYVGKTGKTGKSKNCDVFYKSNGGSGRIPHHIVGGKNVLFKKAHKLIDPNIRYNDFVNRYSVLCVVIDPSLLGSKFETCLLWWEAYLILSLIPLMNENIKINIGKPSSRHRNFEKYFPRII